MSALIGELIVLSGPYKGRRVPISKNLIKLGRDRTCDVHLEDEAASRVHTEIHHKEGKLRVKDMGSTNGTYVNDARVDEAMLSNGDRLGIGDTVFLVEMDNLSSRTGFYPGVVFTEDKKGVTTRVTLSMDETRFLEIKEGTSIPDAQRQFGMLYEFMVAVTGILHRPALMERTLDFMMRSFKGDRGVLMLLTPDGVPGHKIIRVRDGLKQDEDISISRTMAQEILEKKESFLSTNAETDERLSAAESIHSMQVRSIIGVPLKLKDRVLGLLYMDRLGGQEPFDETDLKVCTAMCLQAAVCLENASLYQELLNAAEFNNSIQRSLTSGLIVVNNDGQIIRVNKAALEILRCHESTLLNRKLSDHENLKDLNKVVENTLKTHKSEDRHEVRLRIGESTVPIGLSTSPLTDHAGRVVGMVAHFRSLTHVRRLEEQLRRSQHLAALGQMAAGVAHEIRNPLNSVRGFTQLVQEGAGKDGEESKVREYTQIVLEEVDRMNRIVQDLLDFSRQRELTLVPVHMEKLIGDLGKDMDPEFKKAKVELKVAPPGEPLPGNLGNDDKLRQVFRNILLNALQASKEGDRVEVSFEIEENPVLPADKAKRNGGDPATRREVAIHIRDHGVGIEPDDLPRIFDPFYTNKDIGTGLGLSISQKIVDQHGGRIDVDSEPGKGSTFSVYLPAV